MIKRIFRKSLNFILGLYVVCGQESCWAGRDLTFKQAWEEGGGSFQSSTLHDVSRLYPSTEDELTPEMQYQLATSTALIHVNRLDLRKQRINDRFIRLLAQNPSFARVTRLDLSGNQEITVDSLQQVWESPYIGSIRDTYLRSDHFGDPSTEIQVCTIGTSITKAEAQRFVRNPKRGFKIQYIHPAFGIPTYPEEEDAIKLLNIEDIGLLR